jgi:hypothetical protein
MSWKSKFAASGPTALPLTEGRFNYVLGGFPGRWLRLDRDLGRAPSATELLVGHGMFSLMIHVPGASLFVQSAMSAVEESMRGPASWPAGPGDDKGRDLLREAAGRACLGALAAGYRGTLPAPIGSGRFRRGGCGAGRGRARRSASPDADR